MPCVTASFVCAFSEEFDLLMLGEAGGMIGGFLGGGAGAVAVALLLRRPWVKPFAYGSM